jgi:hypothetical protein
LIKAPTYRVVQRRQWVGIRHVCYMPNCWHWLIIWQARWLVIDATGVGAGLASFLERSLPGKVLPFFFTSASKSKLGWDFLGMIDSGRWKEHRTSGHYSRNRLNFSTAVFLPV